MAMQLFEHLYTLSETQRLKELGIILLMMLVLIIVNWILEKVKRKYENNVLKSECKILKFIFKYII